MKKIPKKICLETLGKYLFTDLLSVRISGTKIEESTDFEFDLFETLLTNWYTVWKRNSKVLKTFSFLCGCKEHSEFKKFLDVENTTMYRGIHISNMNTPFGKYMTKKIMNKLSLKMTLEGFDWVGYSEEYIPKYEIESWTDSTKMAFSYGYGGAAGNPKVAYSKNKTYIKKLQKLLKDHFKNPSGKSMKSLEKILMENGYPVFLVSKADQNSVMKPIFSNHLFKEATQGSMSSENEIVQLTKKNKPCGWYVPVVVIEILKIINT